MARSHREPPPRFFHRSEFRRVASLTFLLVILWMILEESRGPNHYRMLIGRAGNQDQVVGAVDDEEMSDGVDRVPAATNAADALSTATSPAPQTVALAQPAYKGGSADAAKATDASTSSPSGDDKRTATGPTPAPGAASDSSAKPAASSAAASSPPSGEATVQPAVSIHYNMGPTPIAQSGTTSPNPDSKPAAEPLPPATGPTDEDPDEASAAAEDLDFVNDGSAGIDKTEMPAYERVARWVTSQSYERMADRSKPKKLNYAQTISGADDHRGKLFQFDLHVRRATAYDDKLHFYNDDEDPHEPVQLYEMWGDTSESRGRLVQLVVYDPPAGMPIGPSIEEDVRFVGYFFKLQGYQPAKAAPGAKPEIAPTFIGRVAWMKRPPTVLVQRGDLWWIAASAGCVLAILVGWLAWLLMRKTRPNVAELAVDLSIPSAVSIDEWLEHPETGGPADRRARRDDESNDGSRRNLFEDAAGGDGAQQGDSEPDAIRPKQPQNGHGNGHATLFSDHPDAG